MQTTDQTETREAGSSPASGSALDEQLKLAKAAIFHVLNAIADDPRKFWLMGDMTGSHEKLTAAAAVIWGKPQDEIKAHFRPRKDKWEQYCDEKEADEKLLRYCRDHGIKPE